MGCEETGNTLYAGTWSDGLYRSANGGSTWPLASPDLQYADVRDIATDSRGARRVYAATTRGVYAITETTAAKVDVQVALDPVGQRQQGPGQAGAARHRRHLPVR